MLGLILIIRKNNCRICENGAKAVADEGTNKRADQEFWNKYSVKEISEKSDYWLNSQGRLTDPMILNENSDRYKKLAGIVHLN